MFNYLKTIGAHSGAPEPEFMPVLAATAIVKGSICEMEAGALTNSFTAGKSKFVALEGKAAKEAKGEIKCIRVLPGMIFDVEFNGDPTELAAGMLVTPLTGSDGCYIYCEDGEGGTIEVVDASSYDSTGMITVTIHC